MRFRTALAGRTRSPASKDADRNESRGCAGMSTTPDSRFGRWASFFFACPTIGELARSRDNNFNLLRFVAASAVLLSHCWPLTLGSNEAEPLARIFPGLTLGTSAVIVFFAISGFLVASSWERSRSAWAFLVARILRIYPGL